MNSEKHLVSISIVSHGQTALVNRLLKNLDHYHEDVDLEVILTENTPPEHPLDTEVGNFKFHQIINPAPRGLAANHNQAFNSSTGDFFCVINPDVILIKNIFPTLISDIKNGLGDITAPLIINNAGIVQDSFRPIPNPLALMRRFFRSGGFHLPHTEEDLIYPDWIAGIILCMCHDTFQQLGGMDERYYLYFEDVDFCCRARLEGLRVLLDTRVQAVHEARRHSRKDLRYFLIHLRSAGRFFLSKTYWQARRI